MPPDWPVPLRRRVGARKRLLGIRVYCDFRWTELFPDQRTQFTNGLSLAKLVRDECPTGKTPALLLTTDDDAREQALETVDEYVVVVRIQQYLAEAQGDAAAAYYAHHLRERLTQAAALDRLRRSPEVMSEFLETHLSGDLLQAWAHSSPGRLEELRSICGPISERQAVDPAEVVRALQELDEVPGGVWGALVEFLPGLLDQQRVN